MAPRNQSGLKRLAFVRSYATSAITLGEGLYYKARGIVPSAAEGIVSQVEDKATSVAAPIVALVQDKAVELLAAVDTKVDGVLSKVDATIAYSREIHSKNMSSFSTAKESAFSTVEGLVNATKAALDPQRYYNYAASLSKKLITAVAAYSDPDKVVAAACTAYDKVASRAPVSKALELADPLISVGQTQYTKAHDALVMQPLYKKIYDTAATIPGKVQETSLYRKGYPLVAPVADPVITNFANSKVIRQIEEHIKPVAAN